MNNYRYLDAIKIPIIICNNDGAIKYINQSCLIDEIIPDYILADYKKYTIYDIFLLNKEQRGEIEKVFHHVIHENKVILDLYELIITKIKKNHIIVQIFQNKSAVLQNGVKTEHIEQKADHEISPFFSAYDLLDDLIHITDKNGKIIYANTAIKKLYGDIKGQYCYQVFGFCEDYCPDCKLSLVLDGNTIRYEVKLKKNNQYYDVINSPFVDFDGNIYKISIMRNLEEIVEKQNTLVLFQNAINRSRNLVCFTSQDGQILYANDTFIKYFGETYKKENNILKLLNYSKDDLFMTEDHKEIKIKIINDELYFKVFVYPIQSLNNETVFVFIASDITDLKNLEKKIDIEKNYFKSIIDNTIDGFFVIDKDQNIIDCNPSFYKMFNISTDSLGTLKLSDLFDPFYKREFDKKINYLKKSRVSQITEVSRSNKEFHNYIISLNYLSISGNDNEHYYGFVKDITDITRLHKIIENERNYNRRIIETVKLGFVVINEYGAIIDYNNAFLQLIGRLGKNVKGEMFSLYITPLDKEIFDDATISSQEMLLDFEAIVHSADNEDKNVIVSMSKLYDILGNYLGHFAFIRDITHQKKIENEIIQQSKQVIELINSLTQFTINIVRIDDVENLISQIYLFINTILSPDYIEILVNTNNIYYSHIYKNNEYMVKNTEISYKTSFVIQKLSKNKSILTITNPDVELNDEDQLLFNNILGFQNIIFIPIFVVKDLKIVIIVAFNKKIEAINNVVVTVLTGVANLIAIAYEKITSLSEQVKMKEALDRYEKLVAIGRIIAGVAHEINNPLSIMQLDIAELDQKLGEGDYDQEIKDIIKSLLEEIQRISNIVKQLKDYAKPAALNDDIIHLNEIFRMYPLKILSKNIQKKGIPININIPKQKIFVKMPLTRLIQVVMNILTNAEDAVVEKGEGSITIDISTELRDSKQFARLTIKDTGIGIHDENKHLLFEPFFTTKSKEGTGLGLSISYSIVKSYNGEIEINSKRGLGTEVIILLPMYQKS
ncbi:MAG: PAS domain S-box protein [Spirochaetes bacterium]|nr:PAS domain S-box protein [Spirochaetota bacterium]